MPNIKFLAVAAIASTLTGMVLAGTAQGAPATADDGMNNATTTRMKRDRVVRHHVVHHHVVSAPINNGMNSYNYANNPVIGPVDAAAGIVGGAVGLAGAIATAPFRAFDAYAYDTSGPYNSYAYYNGYNGPFTDTYARALYNDGYNYESADPVFQETYGDRAIVCPPGTWFRGGDGRRYVCR
jgi:hypothetical protein